MSQGDATPMTITHVDSERTAYLADSLVTLLRERIALIDEGQIYRDIAKAAIERSAAYERELDSLRRQMAHLREQVRSARIPSRVAA